MEAAQFSVHVLRCPFGLREVLFTSGVKAPSAAASLPADPHYAQVMGYGYCNEGLQRSYAVAGTRGIQQLVATTRSVHPSAGDAGTAAGTVAHSAEADLFSLHDKGRLLLWNSESGTVVASHAFHPAFAVHKCVAAGACLYTTLEGSPDTAGAEEETCVYVWDRQTLQPVTVMRGHEGRLTALAVTMQDATPAGAAAAAHALVTTASLDGTVRLWRHRQGEHSGGDEHRGFHGGPVQLLAVLPTSELGILSDLCFLSSDVLVAACSKCAMAFLRVPLAALAGGGGCGVQGSDAKSAAKKAGEELRWQLVRSSVDPDSSTTTLHVCPLRPFDPRKAPANGSADGGPWPAAAAGDSGRKKGIVTGSTSGYMQEWTVEIGDVAAPPLPGDSAAGVVVRGRWHHKAHAATVGTIVTDEDVVVSTSIFDGGRLYHRRAGATCVITTASMVPVLVPQLKQLVWGAVDGTLCAASYALFASGSERQLQLLWSSRPHSAAIRGLSLALTAGLQWQALCVGAADGSVSVWRPSAGATATTTTATPPPPFARVLDVHVPPRGVSAVTIVGMVREPKHLALAVAEVDVGSGAALSTCALPLPSGSMDSVTCARLCSTSAAAAAGDCGVGLWVGTAAGQLLYTTRDAATPPSWSRALKACAWRTAGERSAVTAISPLHLLPSQAALLAVVSFGAVSTSLSTQRVTISVLRTRQEKGTDAPVVERAAAWEGSVDVTAPAQGVLLSVLPSTEEELHFSVNWTAPSAASAGAGNAASTAEALPDIVVRDSRGRLIRCRSTGSQSAVAWASPELLVRAAAAAEDGASAIAATLDAPLAEVLVADSAAADIVSVAVATNRRRVLVKAAARTDAASGGALCDVGTSAVRLAAVNGGGRGAAAALCEVSLFDDKGQEQARVSRDGAVTTLAAAAAAAASRGVLKKRSSLAPVTPSAAPSLASSVRSSSPAGGVKACTLLVASAAHRLLFIGYNDGLLQLVDTADMFVFVRLWLTDDTGTARGIAGVHLAHGVAVVRLANDCIRVVAVPSRSILDQSAAAPSA